MALNPIYRMGFGALIVLSVSLSGGVISAQDAHAASGEIVEIAKIQGTGAASPLVGQKVTTRGVVTASYPRGGFSGYYIQTPGTGGEKKTAGASDAIFVYAAKSHPIPERGTCLEITGQVDEYFGLTQISAVKTAKEIADCAPVTPFKLHQLPGTDKEKETFEGMLVAPEGNYTVTDNYSVNRFGTLGLAAGDEPLKQATDVVSPGREAKAYEKTNESKYIALDDGSSWDYSKRKEAKNTPLPYLTRKKPVRVGAPVAFVSPVILDFRHGWNFQPLQQVTGIENSPVNISNTRTKVPQNVGGDIKVATFNVLNYFTDLGQEENKCKSYKDRHGNPITANGCKVRGAYRKADFLRQEEKIVAAINALGADIVGLEEIENSATFGHHRDYSLKILVEALNKAIGKKDWQLVPSPENTPNDTDAIRTAFIYRPAKVTPVGESKIAPDIAFSGVARSPLAQRFIPVVKDDQVGTEFVVIANHFKSKGSLLNGPENADNGDGQGNNNGARVLQAKALVRFANSFKPTPTFLVGDFNAYSKEDPVRILQTSGYTKLDARGAASYQFKQRVGSLDHVFASKSGVWLVSSTAVWDINASEPLALEYSRYNANVTNLYSPDPYRSSDHNPKIFGLNVVNKKPVDPTPTPSPTASATVDPSPTPVPTYTNSVRDNERGIATGPLPRSPLAQTGSVEEYLFVVIAALFLSGMITLTIRGRLS